MNSKDFIFSILFIHFIVMAFGQETTARPLYELTIYKTTNDDSNYRRTNRRVSIDSLGNVFSDGKQVALFEITNFNREITQFVNHENVTKHPGSNQIMIMEASSPSPGTQLIFVTIKFLDDLALERQLSTKTFYSWNKKCDKAEKEYTFYNYLSESEVALLKSLLE